VSLADPHDLADVLSDVQPEEIEAMSDTTIEQYALDMVLNGAESTVEDDMNEDGEIGEEDHEAACDLGYRIIKVIRANRDVVLGWAGELADEQ
jgi:hypothetical protein